MSPEFKPFEGNLEPIDVSAFTCLCRGVAGAVGDRECDRDTCPRNFFAVCPERDEAVQPKRF